MTSSSEKDLKEPKYSQRHINKMFDKPECNYYMMATDLHPMDISDCKMTTLKNKI